MTQPSKWIHNSFVIYNKVFFKLPFCSINKKEKLQKAIWNNHFELNEKKHFFLDEAEYILLFPSELLSGSSIKCFQFFNGLNF